MALTITLKQTAYSPDGVDFNQYWTDYFADFALEGFPYTLGGDGDFDGDQMVFLDNIDGAATKSLVLDGADIEYYFAEHTMSGSLHMVRLARLGESYNSSDGSFTQEDGHIANIATPVTIGGLSISNPYRERGDFHEVIAALMGGGPGGGAADTELLESFVWAEAHNVVGSAGNDSHSGTRFDDTVRGNGGNDSFDGAGGSDTAIFSGTKASYTVTDNGDGSVTIADNRAGAPDGTDTLRNFEQAQFSDGTTDLSGFGGDPKPDYEVQKGGRKDDKLKGSGISDKLVGGKGEDKLVGKGGADFLKGDRAGDDLRGGSGQDKLVGGKAGDKLNGGRGSDVLKGNNGADVLIGNKAADELHGGSGADSFVFKAKSHSKTTAHDTIEDFARKQGDRIDLSAIDARKGKGNQAFDFIGKDKFSEKKGELRFDKQDGDVFVYGDINGDGEADFAIRLDGGPSLKASDFML